MKVTSHLPSLRQGDLVEVHINETGCDYSGVVVGPGPAGRLGNPADAWVSILIEGKLREIHVSYIREIINESR